MDKPTYQTRLKDLVYRIVLPIYLWSIGYKTLDAYCEDIWRFESALREHKKTNLTSKGGKR